MRLATVWPLFGLAVRTPRLELRYPTDLELVELAERTDDIHDPDFLPFEVPWSLQPEEVREPATLQHTWRSRAEHAPEAWALDLVVRVAGEVIGAVSLRAQGFAVRRTVDTGSWIHRSRQGQRLGREAREAVLHLAFAGLGAQRAETAAYEGNAASRAVTVGLGYRPNGDLVDELDGRTRVCHRFVLDRAGWEAVRRDDIELVGLDPCRALLGADAT